MDVRHLDNEEVRVELEIRNLIDTPEAIPTLVDIIAEECAGQRQMPTAPHKAQPVSEVNLFNKKIRQFRIEYEEVIKEGDKNGLVVLMSRLLHLAGRIQRLSTVAPDLDCEIRSARVNADALINIVEREVHGGPSESSSNEFEGFTADEAAKLPTPINIPPPSTGAIPRPATAWERRSIDKRNDNIGIGNRFDAMNVTENRPPRQSANVEGANQIHLRNDRQPEALDEGQFRNRNGLAQVLSRWGVRFGGSKKDLPIEEFVFRIENLAGGDNIPANSLVWGLHTLLTDGAADFYWIQRRKYPNANWAQLKQAFLSHFSKHENDFEVRKIIMNRRQKSSEEFGDFCLAIECMAARLSRPMLEVELLEILRENMSAKLQDRLLLHHTASVAALKGACKKFEKMWANQNEYVPRDNRMSGRLAALGYETGCELENEPGINFGFSHSNISVGEAQAIESANIAAINRNPPTVLRTNHDHAICWNCDDIGHTFYDCQNPERKIFCFGCGAKNIYKPKCGRCNPGNAKPGGNQTGRFRPSPDIANRSNPFANH